MQLSGSSEDRTRRPTLELRIPISPNDKYLRMLRYLCESLVANGGPISRNAHYVVSVSRECEPFDLPSRYPWTQDYSLRFEWLDEDSFSRDTYDATGYHRFAAESDADVVGMIDADLLVTGDLDALVERVYERNAVAGFIAHASPFAHGTYRATPSERWWRRLYTAAGLNPPVLDREHTAWGLMSSSPLHRYCPAYYNYGLILAPRMVTEAMGREFLPNLRLVETIADSWYRSQVANTLVIERLGVTTLDVSINYNFPLHVDYDAIRSLNPDPEGQDEASDIRLFHYLGRGEVNKEHFSTEDTFRSLLDGQGRTPGSRYFLERLRQVHERLPEFVSS